MRGKQPGSLCWIYYDGAAPVDESDVIETQTGKRYLVQKVRVQQKGIHAGRQHLMCLVMAEDEDLPEGATVHPIYWYARN